MRIVILAEVAARTDDRNLLQQMVNDASDAYSTGSSVVRWVAARVLALARGSATTSTTRCAGSATSRFSKHHSGPRS